MASTMLHEKCCNTVLQIGAPLQIGRAENRARKENATTAANLFWRPMIDQTSCLTTKIQNI